MSVKLGINLPFERDRNGHFAMTTTLADAARANMINLLLTVKGERPFLPEFGSDLQNMIFENVTPSVLSDLKLRLRKDIERWIPFVQVDKIEMRRFDEQPYRIFIGIDFTTSDEPERNENLTVDFDTR